jgi:NADPH:quinone reductase-like Zn-dependent oxidoreductase
MKSMPNLFAKRPHVAENDFSGVVVDSNGTHFSSGDNVYGWIPVSKSTHYHVLKFNSTLPSGLQFETRQGALAEYICVPADYFVIRPSNITPVQAAGINLAGLTSYQALIHIGKLETGQTVFINGGSSAVGAFAIQIAKAKGARVVATASGKNEAFARKMGADEVSTFSEHFCFVL